MLKKKIKFFTPSLKIRHSKLNISACRPGKFLATIELVIAAPWQKEKVLVGGKRENSIVPETRY